MSGKRVNFSGRTVISPDPNLELDQLGVPVDVCKLLHFGEMVNKHNLLRMQKMVLNGPDKYPGAVMYLMGKNNPHALKTGRRQRKNLRFPKAREIAYHLLRPGDKVERHLTDKDIVLFNRQPSLHRVSIMSHRLSIRVLLFQCLKL